MASRCVGWASREIADGVVALPLDARTRERFEWLAEEVVENGGEATRLAGGAWRRPPRSESSPAQMAAAVATDYRRSSTKRVGARRVRDRRRRSVARLRRELRRIGSRDYFPPADREQARSAVEALAVLARGGLMRWATGEAATSTGPGCAWLIRRFIDPDAEFVFVDDPDDVPADATAFDMPRRRALAITTAMQLRDVPARGYDLVDPALVEIGRIIHEADLADERFDAPEARGLDVAGPRPLDDSRR